MSVLKNIYLKKVLLSHWCKLVFLLALIGGYFLIPPTILSGLNLVLALTFLILFAFVTTCLVRNIKEKVSVARTSQVGILGILAIIFGFSALQMCAVNSVCLVGAGAGILSLIFPGVMFSFLEKYAVAILIVSILIQLATLYFMGCFKCLTHKLSPPSTDTPPEE